MYENKLFLWIIATFIIWAAILKRIWYDHETYKASVPIDKLILVFLYVSVITGIAAIFSTENTSFAIIIILGLIPLADIYYRFSKEAVRKYLNKIENNIESESEEPNGLSSWVWVGFILVLILSIYQVVNYPSSLLRVFLRIIPFLAFLFFYFYILNRRK